MLRHFSALAFDIVRQKRHHAGLRAAIMPRDQYGVTYLPVNAAVIYFVKMQKYQRILFEMPYTAAVCNIEYHQRILQR